MDIRSPLHANTNQNNANTMNEDIIFCTRAHRSTDPRDKIYTLFGVYCDFINELLINTERIDFLDFTGLQFCKNSFNLSTWVPNWHEISLGFFMLGKTWYSADKGMKDVTRKAFIGKPCTLHANGIVCSTVRTVECKMDLDRFFRWCWTYASNSTEYITGISRLQAVIRLSYADQDPSTDQPIGPHSSLAIDPVAAGGFIKAMRGSYDGENQEEFWILLGINLDTFVESYSKQVFGLCTKESEPLLLGYDYWAMAACARTLRTLLLYTLTKCLFSTSDGYLGWGPHEMLLGDSVCVLNGCHIPLILRQDNLHYKVVGSCFALGLMEGEAMQLVQDEHMSSSKILCPEIHLLYMK
ncbi:hypothetical protein HD806DRAFT_523911 [Xylariaceae sp. AK1471]|nr:hypothetical protein HD806DRAFT_523911 [Xylariaceae sp. AK1471]